MKTNNIGLGLLLIILAIFIAGCASNQPEDPGKTSLAQCLTQKGAKMYGTNTCSHCQIQKDAFGPSFDHVDYVDCNINREECLIAGIEAYPTWEIGGTLYRGRRSLENLAQISGCNL